MTDTYTGTVEVITFTIAEGAPGGTITITVRDPNGTHALYVAGTDPEITNPSAGVYVIDVPCPVAGEWLAVLTAVGGTLEGAYAIRWRIKSTGL